MITPLRAVTGTLLAAAMVAAAPLPAVSAPVQTYLVSVPTSNAAAHAPAVSAVGGRVQSVLENVDILVVRMSPNAAARLAENPRWHVEPEQGVAIAATQDNPGSWGLDRIDQVDLPLNAAYTYPDSEAGGGVTAYIMDTGIRRDHREFSGRLDAGWYGYTDTSGTGDCQGHGTHVAGTVGGSTLGVARSVRLSPVVVLGCDGKGTSTAVVSGADWIIADQSARSGAAVVNMSLGGGASTAIDAAVRKMVDNGITVVVAAGNNSGADACNYSPAREPKAITVGATTNTDQRASFSNVGSCLDLFAPGASIVSAYNRSATDTASLSGTSMASPHTAGVVARYLSARPAATPAEVWGAVQPTLVAGRVTQAGNLSPNLLLYANPAGFAIDASTVADAPTGLTLTGATSSSLGLRWSAPENTGGSPITGYQLSYATNSTFTGATALSVGSSTTSATISGLNASTTYFIRVAAVNAVGTSAWSPTVSGATTAAVVAPGAVTNFTATATSRTAIALSWTPPEGAISSYRLQVSQKSNFSGATTTTVSGSARSVTVSSLKANTRYYFRIAAVNDAGQGAWASASAVTFR